MERIGSVLESGYTLKAWHGPGCFIAVFSHAVKDELIGRGGSVEKAIKDALKGLR